MYFLYRYHHIMPSTYYNIQIDEKIEVNAIVRVEIELLIEEAERLKGD